MAGVVVDPTVVIHHIAHLNISTYGEMMARTLSPLLGATSANHLPRVSASCFAGRIVVTWLVLQNGRVEVVCAYHRPHTTSQRAAVAY